MNPLEIFQKEAPEIAAAFNGLIEALKNMSGLDAKTKHLAREIEQSEYLSHINI